MVNSRAAAQRQSLTAAALARYQANPPTNAALGAAEYLTIYDTTQPGLSVRVRRSGAITFFASGRIGGTGRFVRVTLGKHPTMTVKGAREAARKQLLSIAAGEDPRKVRVRKRAAAQATGATLSDVWAHYLDHHLRKFGKDKNGTVQSLWRVHVGPRWGATRISDVVRGDVVAWHTEVGTRNSKPQANRSVKLLRTLFNHAVDEMELEVAQPVRKIAFYEEVARERDLTTLEQVRLMTTLSQYPDRDFADMVSVLMLTGIRRGNVLAMRWDDIDLESGSWRIPAVTVKTRKTIRVQLSAQVLSLLRNRLDISQSPWVFPASKSKSGHVENIDKRWQVFCAAAQLVNFRINDLRAFFISSAKAAGISEDAIQEQVGHVLGSSVTKRHYTTVRVEQKREAANAVARFVAGVMPS